VAMLLPGESRPVEWQTSNDAAAVRRLVRKVQRAAGPRSRPASAEQAPAAPWLGLDGREEDVGQGHRLWLRSLRFEHKEDQWVLGDYLLAIEHLEERLRALDAHIEQVARIPDTPAC